MIWQMIEDWFRGILTDGILSNLSGLFDSVNTEVGEIATQVGTTPAGWNAGIFNMIRSLSENVIVPIAGVIITFVMCYELIQLVIEKNNLHDLDTWIFFTYFHINVVLGVMLCRFHPLTDKVGVLVHKVYDALVIFGVLVVLAVALHHFEGSQVHLYGFNNLIANPCR